jgi:hypothetical protein
MKFLNESTDTPREKDVMKLELRVPDPGTNEYRRYFNHRTVQQSQNDTVDGNTTEKQITVPCADYVAVLSDHDPTDDEWTAVLSANGYTADQITAILKGE